MDQKIIFFVRIEACAVNAGLNLAFMYFLSIVTIFAETLVAINSESFQR